MKCCEVNDTNCEPLQYLIRFISSSIFMSSLRVVVTSEVAVAAVDMLVVIVGTRKHNTSVCKPLQYLIYIIVEVQS